MPKDPITVLKAAAFALIASLWSPLASNAAVTIQAGVSVPSSNQIPVYDSTTDPEAVGATAWWHQVGTDEGPLHDGLDPDGWAYSLANASDGMLRAGSASPWTTNQFGQINGGALATAKIQESFWFSATSSSFATLHYAVHLALLAGPQGATYPSDSYGRFNLTISNVQGENRDWLTCIGLSSECVAPGNYWLTGAVNIPVNSSVNYTLAAHLYSQSGAWGASRLENTALLYLEMPAGVSIISESGVLFATAQPVPEPSTAALLATGFGIVLIRVFRKLRGAA